MDQHSAALDRAHQHALDWLSSLADRPVPPQASIDQVTHSLGVELPDHGTDPAEVIDLLVEACTPGLTAMPSGRFFGFVIGGTHPAALAADWLVSAWDQNSGLRRVTPAHSAVEDLTSTWLLDLLGLPAESAVGFVTGATMANFTGLAAGRDAALRQAGWDVAKRGLTGGPRVRVLVGAERHDTVDLALRYLGLGSPETVPVDDQGRLRADALESALSRGNGDTNGVTDSEANGAANGEANIVDGAKLNGSNGTDGPTIVVLQAGNVHSGAFDPFSETIALAHAHGAWVHIDGAFGLWAAASPSYRHLVSGYDQADSWATDAHKTLNVPYDCGLAIVRDAAALRASMGMHGAYLILDERGEPFDKVPEISRRGRAFPVWAVLRSLGRSGVAELIERLCLRASSFAGGLQRIEGATILNDVDFTQVCVTFGSNERTEEVVRRLLADGTAWMTGSTWRDQSVLRISVSNWSTTADDVERSLDAVRKAVIAL